jgi:hypothetical protein
MVNDIFVEHVHKAGSFLIVLSVELQYLRAVSMANFLVSLIAWFKKV